MRTQSVLVSHLRGDEFSQATRRFLQWARKTRQDLVMSDVAYGELYAGIHLSENPSLEERRVQRLLAVNKIETRLAGSLEVAKRAGEIYATYLKKRGERVRRILPDFLLGAHAEIYASQLVTWNPENFKNYLAIDVTTPRDLIRKL